MKISGSSWCLAGALGQYIVAGLPLGLGYNILFDALFYTNHIEIFHRHHASAEKFGAAAGCYILQLFLHMFQGWILRLKARR